jgi:hypothetical protein
MDYKQREEFVGPHIQMRQATDALNTQAEEVYEIARKLEDLTKDTTIRYWGLRVRVEARALPSSRQRIYARLLKRWVSR